MTEQERGHLAQADRHIAECKGHIARQKDLIRQIAQRGQSTLWAEDMLEALQASRRALRGTPQIDRCSDGCRAMTARLILKRSPLGPEQNQDDFDVLADDVIVGRIFFVSVAMPGKQWMWTLGYGHHEDRTPTHGYEATREAAMAAFAKSWRGREL